MVVLFSIYQLKTQFQNLLKPLMLQLYRRNISANQVTIVTMFCCLAMAAILYSTPYLSLWLLLPLFMLLRMAANAIDGMLSKHAQQTSDLGFVLNEITDLLADAALLLAFSSVVGFDSYWLISMLLLTWLTEFIALLIQLINGERQNSGPLGKSDRAVFLSVFALFLGSGYDSYTLSLWFFISGHLLLIWTCINRLRQGLKTTNG